MTKSILFAAVAAVSLSQGAPAFAQAAASFPTKSVTIIVPATPGGAIDLVARLTGDQMSKDWGKPVVIDNKAGATGTIGTQAVATAAPDGHMLALVASSHAINPVMFKKLPYDTVKSFEPVILTHVVPLVLVVNPKLPVSSVKELIAYGKANPGKLTFASSGNGGAPHMSGELFKSMAGIDMTHIPYKGSAAAHPDLMSGQTQVMFDTLAAVQPHLKTGALKGLAVTTAKRVPGVDLPTIAEAGLPGYETTTWGGVLAPAGTPKDVVAKLNAEFNKGLAQPDIKKKINDAGIDVAGGTPQQFADFLQAEMKKWAKVAKDANIQPE
ncbi:MAG: tripartite tricarboxylate transporter substrate binding protein [Casimicrobiaceae bacterium]|jgi:tripartite-type tricarboxylate transporter receptor subunit TctC